VDVDDAALGQWEKDLESLARRFGGEYDDFERDVRR
jgi:protein-S-isoprenylcysteine O-methyltransferase Ste14